IGLGGALTNATALVVETAPMRWRSLLTMATVVGVPVGGVIGGEVSARLIPAQGWESVFVIGGVVPLALAAALALWMPESARFLLRANRPGAEVAQAVNALIGEERFRPEDALWLEEPAARKASFKDLFGATLRRDTAGVWTIFLANLFGMFCFLNWLPTVLAGLGHDLATSSRMLGAYNLGGIAGTVLAAWLIGYIGSRRVLAGVAAGGVLSAVLMGQADLSLAATALALCIFSGICLNAMQVGAYLLSAHVYPTTVRATGVGSAVAVGRIGALASSFAGAIVGTGAGGASLLFGIVAFSMLLVLGGVMLVRNHVPAHH
ncbi:MAG: MFS transporter, partial [Gammaproteobacteria bacterium]